jgi:methyl-accepting chemotaxis protein
MTSGRSQRKLRNFLIRRDIQLRIVFHNLIYFFLVIVVTLAAAISPILQDITFSGNLEKQYHASQILLAFLTKWVPLVGLVILFFILLQIVYTHRFLGPLVNFTHTFRHVARGDFTRKCRLRKGDYLIDESKEINLMVDGLSELVIQAQQECGEMSDCLQKAILSLKEGRKAGIEDVKESVIRFKDAMSRFKLAP